MAVARVVSFDGVSAERMEEMKARMNEGDRPDDRLRVALELRLRRVAPFQLPLLDEGELPHAVAPSLLPPAAGTFSRPEPS